MNQHGSASLAQSSPTVGTFRERGGALEWSGRQETVRVEPWGPDAVRVRARLGGPVLEGLPAAVLDEPPASGATVKIEDGRGLLTVGALTVEVDAEGLIRFVRTGDGAELLTEERAHFWWPGPRLYTPVGNGHHRLEQRFAAYEGEKLYGLGQHQHGLLDQKGAVLDLVQRNAEVTIPVLTSSRGYTLLWNSPAIGRVELAHNGTRWVADSARQIDYWITAGDPADAQRRYSAVTGRTPMLPDWAAGFWQCKLRYRTQDELLGVAREYKRRGLPIDVIVCDFFHWTHLGDWKFDPAEWPDPAGMRRELAELGIRLVVSVWPSVSPLSENHQLMEQHGWFVGRTGLPGLRLRLRRPGHPFRCLFRHPLGHGRGVGGGNPRTGPGRRRDDRPPGHRPDGGPVRLRLRHHPVRRLPSARPAHRAARPAAARTRRLRRAPSPGSMTRTRGGAGSPLTKPAHSQRASPVRTMTRSYV